MKKKIETVPDWKSMIDEDFTIMDTGHSIDLVYTASNKRILAEEYTPGVVSEWVTALTRARSFVRGWTACRNALAADLVEAMNRK